MTYVLIAIGGAVGAVLRFAVDDLVSRWLDSAFPFGTLVIRRERRVPAGAAVRRGGRAVILPTEVRPGLMIGLLGAYTTFSTWMLESWRLLEDGAWLYALVNIGGSVLAGIVAVSLGIFVWRFV